MKNKLLSYYFQHPLHFDILLIMLLLIVFEAMKNVFGLNIIIKNSTLESVTTDLINTSISLAGFVLASLTIIVTFKDNIR